MIGKGIGTNVYLINKYLTFFYPGIGILEVYEAKPQRFDFGSQKDHPRLVDVLDKPVVPGLSVLSDCLYVFFVQKGLSFIEYFIGQNTTVSILHQVNDTFGGSLFQHFRYKGSGFIH